jgi:hypothetical protein
MVLVADDGVIVPWMLPVVPVDEAVTGEPAKDPDGHRSTVIEPRRLLPGVELTVIDPGEPEIVAV